MIVQFVSVLYQNASNGYTVAVYETAETDKIPDSAVRQLRGRMVSFTAVGTELPAMRNAEFEMEGNWKESERYGKQYYVDWFRIILPKTRDGILGYLSSGIIKGIGPSTAARIVDLFGTDTFRVFDESPKELLKVKGITEKKLEEIMEAYRGSAGIRELLAFLAPYHVTPKKAEKIQEHFGVKAARIVKEQPYRLCEVKGFGFLTVDPIARASRDFAADDPERVKAAIRYVLKEAEKEGHLFLESPEVIERALRLLNQGFAPDTVKTADAVTAGNSLVLTEKKLGADGRAVFLKENRDAEVSAAYHINRILSAPAPVYDVEQLLEETQAEFGIILAEKQKEAVRMVFKSPLSIITGGPGKGKTTNLRIILRIYERLERNGEVLACAPTGRARKRLAESTGYPAMTIHKALYLKEDDDYDTDADMLMEDFIIADEFTMADMRLASILFSRIKSGARVVLVGDVDQLPSVGPGNVFKEMIESGVIPVTVLDVFFRQAQNSRIIINSNRMNQNQKNLLYGEDFRFVYAESPEEASEKIQEIYREELAKNQNAPDRVQVLSPLRVNTEAGVNTLNRNLRELVNPPSINKAEWKAGARLYRVGDKVMQTKNTEAVSNGDIGSLTDICVNKDGQKEITVDYGDVQKNYQEDELEILDHAYAMSIHKSQGAEYPVVIIPVLKSFYPMLRRNVYYTGITRAKERVYLVGTKQALYMAIANGKKEQRNTLLARRIRQEAAKKGYQEMDNKAA